MVRSPDGNIDFFDSVTGKKYISAIYIYKYISIHNNI